MPIARVKLEFPEEELLEQLESYRRAAVERGASDARVVPAFKVPIDERVALKCRVPICFGFGTSANCPPHTLRPEETRAIVSMYRYAVVFKLDVPPEVIVRDRATVMQRVEFYRKVFDIVSTVESMAFYDGHYLAVGFASGSCKSTFCHKMDCAVLKGERCRNELRSRPSMEAVGMDAYRLATELGWEIYPIGSSCKSESVPHGTLMGLVLIR